LERWFLVDGRIWFVAAKPPLQLETCCKFKKSQSPARNWSCGDIYNKNGGFGRRGKLAAIFLFILFEFHDSVGAYS